MFKQSSKFSFQDIVIHSAFTFFFGSVVSLLGLLGSLALSYPIWLDLDSTLYRYHPRFCLTVMVLRFGHPLTHDPLHSFGTRLSHDPNALSSLSTIVSYHRLTRTACFRILRIGISPYLVSSCLAIRRDLYKMRSRTQEA